MITKKQITLIAAIAFGLFVIFGLVIWREDVALEWYMMQLKSESDGGKIIHYEEKIQEIAPLVMQRLEEFWFNPNSASIQVRAATLGIAVGSEAKAKEIFKRGINSENENLVIESIYGFGIINEKDVYIEIISHAESQNDKMRTAVADYLNQVLLPESVPLLNSMLTDENEYIKYLVKNALEKINSHP